MTKKREDSKRAMKDVAEGGGTINVKGSIKKEYKRGTTLGQLVIANQ